MKKYIINIKVYVKHTLVLANSVEKRTAFACEYIKDIEIFLTHGHLCVPVVLNSLLSQFFQKKKKKNLNFNFKKIDPFVNC